MTTETRRGLLLLGLALAAGIGGDVLLTNLPSRLNLAAWIGWLGFLVLAAGQRGWLLLPRERWPLWLLGVGFIPALFWRESADLFLLNLAAIGTVAVWASPRVPIRTLRLAALADLLIGAARAGVGAALGPLPALGQIQWAEATSRRGGMALAGRIVLGALLILPVLVLFGLLLGHADPLFGRLLSSLVSVDLTKVAPHVARTGVFGWLAGGVVAALYGWSGRRLRFSGVATTRLDLPVIATAMLLVEGLLLAFLVVQARYLFGGAAVVEQLSGLSYAEYARRGFFELLVVAGVCLPLLLAGAVVLDPSRPVAVRRFRLLGAVLLGLLGVLLLSAAIRLRLYVSVFGLTETRVFAGAALAWLLLTMGWLGPTVLRGHRRRFAPGALAAGLGLVVALNVVNPGDLVARINLGHRGPAGHLDVAYLVGLGDDAVPTLLRQATRLPPADRCALLQAMTAQRAADAKMWTLAGRRAERVWRTDADAARVGCLTGTVGE